MADDKEGLAGYDEYNPFTNPDTRPRETRGFQPDPMAQTVRELPGKLLTNADENLTKNIVALTPKPKESRYGSIRMPRMSDDPGNAGMFVMAGPIAVEEALGKFAAKALPAKTIETKLLQMGASKAELETRGVTGYLEAQGTRPVHPLEVMKHLDDNPYQLKEIVKTDNPRLRQALTDAERDRTIAQKAHDDIRLDWLKVHDVPPTPQSVQQGLITQQEFEFYHKTRGDVLNANRRVDDIAAELGSVDNPKFGGWQTPGGENYREILLQAPVEQKTGWSVFDVARPNKTLAVLPDEATAAKYIEDNGGAYGHLDYLHGGPETTKHPKFVGGHWDEPNVVAHMRVNDRTLPSGEKALHVEEWQSDWASAARHRPGPEVSGREAAEQLTPSHPIVDNWQDLMARRTMKEAADGGYDRLTWTTGAQQADRYDLAAHVQSIRYYPKGDLLEFKPKGGGEWQFFASAGEEGVTADELARHIGKDPAKRLMEAPEREGIKGELPYKMITGLDLKVGGEWANKLYDESMVNRFNKIGKRYGVQVEKTKLDAGGFKVNKDSNALPYRLERTNSPGIIARYATAEEAWAAAEKEGSTTVHSLKITPEMRKSIGAAKFHPFADLPGPKPKPVAPKTPDLHAEAAALDPSNPVRYAGDIGGFPMFQQEPPGVGSFIQRPGETVAAAFERAKARYQR